MSLPRREQPLLDDVFELPPLAVSPRPPHPRGGRGSFASSYGSRGAGSSGSGSSSVSYSSSRLFGDDTDGHEVDVDDLDSDSSRGGYALLSMPIESVKKMSAARSTTGSWAKEEPWTDRSSSYRRAAAIADALRDLQVRESRRNPIEGIPGDYEEDEEEEEEAGAGRRGSERRSVSLKDLLFHLASKRDVLVLGVGILASSVHGGLWALMAFAVEATVAAFVPFDSHRVDSTAMTFLLLALALGATGYTAHMCLAHSAERQLRTLREQALRRLLLDLDQSWFDAHASSVPTLGQQLTRDALTIQQGLGPALGTFCQFVTQFLGGFAAAFAANWELTLAVSCVTPVVVGILVVLLSPRRTMSAEKEAHAVATEALEGVRTLLALNAQRRVREKYATRVRIVEHERVSLRGKHAALHGALHGSMWAMAAVGLWYGGLKVYRAEATPSAVFQTFVGALIGSRALGQLLPAVDAIAEAKRAAYTLFALLDSPSACQAANFLEDGVQDVLPRPVACAGALIFVDVHFAYPTRPDHVVLRRCNVQIAAGECVAVVGASRAGKSTLAALLTRLYEPSQGLILLDGRELTMLDPTWLRAQIGLVPQDPTLFAASIFDNIAMGLVAGRDLERHTPRNGSSRGGRAEERARVLEAAKRAKVHDLIKAFPEGYDTLVGRNGVALSREQRQRLALARALVRDPKLLILDEVADAPVERLSTTQTAGSSNGSSERDMTTLVFSRQANGAGVRHADRIVVLEAGKVVEQGTPSELLQRLGGVYRRLHLEQSQQEEVLLASEPQIFPGVRRRRPLEPPMAGKPPFSTSKFTQRDVKALSRPERKFLAVGLASAAVMGVAAPLLGLLISEMMVDMTEQYARFLGSHDSKGLLATLRPLIMQHGFFLCAGTAIVVVFHSLQLFCLGVASERVASRLSDVHFYSLLAQPLAFFDASQHSTKTLAKALATQPAKAALAVGYSQGFKLQILCTVAAAMAVAFWCGSWMLTIVLVAALPLLLLGEGFRAQQQLKMPVSASGEEEAEDEEAVEAHASEALKQRRTVVELGLERAWCASFELLQRPLRRTRRTAQFRGLARAFSAVVLVATCALACWLGGVLVRNGDASARELARSFLVVVVSAQVSGVAMAWLSEVDGALEAGTAISSLRDAATAAAVSRGLPPPPSSSVSSEGELELSNPVLNGSVDLHNVRFAYPTQPDMLVLDGLSLHIEVGQTVALCGPSGAGKSTVLALIERFYDLQSPPEVSSSGGRVLLDGVDSRALDVGWLRAQIGYVGPNPTLFLGTIAENIAYGMPALPSQEAIVAAAQVAHAHAFISRLPDGYATLVGGLASQRQQQLSPGQRQRIALARVVLQDPGLLLLDEPTRALGAESEKLAVQQALDTIVAQRVRRTTVIAAHPGGSLTVQNADMICVLANGRLVEQGTHAELLQVRGGLYARLVREATSSSTASSLTGVSTV